MEVIIIANKYTGTQTEKNLEAAFAAEDERFVELAAIEKHHEERYSHLRSPQGLLRGRREELLRIPKAPWTPRRFFVLFGYI